MNLKFLSIFNKVLITTKLFPKYIIVMFMAQRIFGPFMLEIKANEKNIQAIVPCMLCFQEEMHLPYNYALLTAKVQPDFLEKTENNVALKSKLNVSLKELVLSLKEMPLEIEWDYYAAHSALKYSKDNHLTSKQGAEKPKNNQNLCCLDSESVVRFWIKIKDINKVKKIVEKNDIFCWKIEGCQAREIEQARQTIRKKLLQNARTEATAIAESMNYQFTGFKQMAFSGQPITGQSIQGISFDLKEGLLEEDANFFENICKLHSAMINERIECVALFSPNSIEAAEKF